MYSALHTHTPILARKRMPGVGGGGGGGRCPSLIPVISEALYLVVGLGGWMDGWMDDTTLCTNTNKKGYIDIYQFSSIQFN